MHMMIIGKIAGGRADGGADDFDGQRLHGCEEDDERYRSDDVHDHVEDAVNDRVFE